MLGVTWIASFRSSKTDLSELINSTDGASYESWSKRRIEPASIVYMDECALNSHTNLILCFKG